MYLNEFKNGHTVTRTINDIASKHGITVNGYSSAGLISSSVIFSSAGSGKILLSEFPGNCSSLILSNIQSNFNGEGTSHSMKNNLNCAIEICLALEYGALFVSGTYNVMRDILIKEYGFEIIMDRLMNPHSGMYNYFLVKKFDYTIKEEPVIEEELEEEESYPLAEDVEDPEDIEMHIYLDTRRSGT